MNKLSIKSNNKSVEENIPLYARVSKRDVSIDILKFFAAIIITWSHMEKPLGEYSMLATGGTFGDVLFFYCSGYTLFLGKEAGFFNWYKRRINRIYPTVFSWALICSIIYGKGDDMLQVIISGGGWFVSCIMIYYVLLWFVRKYMINLLRWVIFCAIVVTFIWYIFLGPGVNGSMYGETYFKWCHYFLFMLLGAICGLRYKRGQY